MFFHGVKAIPGRVEELVEHIITRRNQARGEQGHADMEDTSPCEQGRLIKQGKQNSQQHEHIFKPMIYTSDLNVRP